MIADFFAIGYSLLLTSLYLKNKYDGERFLIAEWICEWLGFFFGSIGVLGGLLEVFGLSDRSKVIKVCAKLAHG